MATRNNLIEQIKVLVRVASTAFTFGGFLKSNGLGQVLPLTPGAPVVQALGLEEVTSQDPYYAVASDMYVDGFDVTIDRFLVQITGTATKAMEQLTFDISAGSASIIDVGAVTMVYGTLAVSTFAVGEIVQVTSGSGAGSTMVVVTDNGATGMTFRALNTVGSGALATDTLLGLTGGATAIVTSTSLPVPSQFKLERFISATLGEFSVVKF